MTCNYFVNLKEKYINKKYHNRPSMYNRGVPRIWEGGGGQEFFFSDLGICMWRSDMLRMAKPCALLGGFGGMPPPPEKIF